MRCWLLRNLSPIKYWERLKKCWSSSLCSKVGGREKPQAEKRSTSGDEAQRKVSVWEIILITVCLGFFLKQCIYKEDSPTPPAKEVPQLAVPASSNQPAPSQSNVVDFPTRVEAIHAQNTHWITTSSGIRHNSKCDYYKNSRGRPCARMKGKLAEGAADKSR